MEWSGWIVDWVSVERHGGFIMDDIVGVEKLVTQEAKEIVEKDRKF